MPLAHPPAAEPLRSAPASTPGASPRVAMLCDGPDQGMAWAAALTDAGYAVAPLPSGEADSSEFALMVIDSTSVSSMDLADLQAASPETPMLLVPGGKTDSEILSQSLRAMGAMSGRPQETATLRHIGPLTLDGAAARIEWRSRRVDLTLSEFRVVQLLVDRAGQDASYRDIYDTVKGIGFIAGTGTDGYRANVRAMVKRIRQKFKEADPQFTAIHNYPGFGYRWISEV
ncbi:MAG: winged helix-turn-helix domain-containing protein [Elstera sp.]